MADEKILLNVEETAAYLGIGKTKCREFLREHEHDFVIRIGNRIYANKNLLEQWVDCCSSIYLMLIYSIYLVL